ncbi:MAG: Holliday junction resolvase RuvX [Thiocapsa sp.]|jgi:putative Holliday junction resolvase|nr:Holliday junction resolvase RuvX [Thiocapsa sp.]MCG6896717.1 Holliday junction resolvase RuvX [Thiocapsa sp.]MCG6984788.1 Holliday junction resolvase RuvX [Thiocapsa sp.]
MTALLGFDFGQRKIGVAVGQTLTGSANPLVTLRSRNGKPDWEGIQALVSEWSPGALVVGLPFNMDDSEVDWSPQVHRFARQLHGRFGLAVHLIDERLTSIEARHQTRDRPGARFLGQRDIDAVAAALILETWLCEQR